MQFHSLVRRPLVVIIAAAAAFGAFALASAHVGPPADGVIHSCVNSSSGEIKIVGESSTCKNNQTPLDWNAQGSPGTDGADGTDGTDGTDGVSGYELVIADSDISEVGSFIAKGLTIDCPAGKKVLGGGSQSNTDVVVTLESYPLTDSQWFVRHVNVSDVAVAGVQIRGYAICADVAP